MADFREKIKTISSTKGSTAPEPAKRLGMGCLLIAVLAVSILTFFLAIGLFLNGNWIMGIVLSVFFLMSAMIALVLLFPHKFDSL
ncbi:CHASE2 domain-containing sensor protein [Planomicrobium sp. HSC-17F08]|nr:CHASE2 domain-containing sensor protein [Planomicrobium sp. HSC-17F08]